MGVNSFFLALNLVVLMVFLVVSILTIISVENVADQVGEVRAKHKYFEYVLDRLVSQQKQ